MMQNFSYDPFDPAVMADPPSYYRVLRDEHPVYYIDKWDTYALSRFDDIWQVLGINDGTFVASEGTLPAATVLAKHNDGPVPDPPLHPLPFHANFDAPIYDGVRRCTSGQFRPKSVAALADRIRALANERLDELLPRGTFDLTQDYGGIVAASVVCELVGLPVDLAADVLATVNAGSLAQPGSGVEVANARPGYLEYLVPIIERRRARRSRRASCPSPTTSSATGFPTVRPCPTWRRPCRCSVSSSVARKPCRRSSRTDSGSWAGGPTQMAAVRADLDANVPVAREEMIRYCAPAQWFARTLRKPFTIHGTTIIRASGSSRCSHRPTVTSASTPILTSSSGTGDRTPAGVRPRTAFLPGVHLARLEIAIMVTEWLKRVPDWRIISEARRRARRPVSSGAGTIPVSRWRS